ncbi:hypothetical protein GQ457_17G019990 [Hibiscus cannabinus]
MITWSGKQPASSYHGVVTIVNDDISQFFIFSSYGLGLWHGSVLMGKELASFSICHEMVLIVTAAVMG